MAEGIAAAAGSAFTRFNLHHEDRMGIALSGGGDSVALMHLLAGWKPPRLELRAVIVNHGLRKEAEDECRWASSLASTLGIACDIITLDPSDWSGNLQANARMHRYQVISAWAKEGDVGTVALGHTRTDQAETVLMNLSRGSGVDGLSAMPDVLRRHETRWVRPLLAFGRMELREYLRERSVSWVDDPGNEDSSYHRIRIRSFLSGANPLGLTEEGLVTTALRMQDVRLVLDRLTSDAMDALVTVNPIGEYFIRPEFHDLDAAVRDRLLGRLVRLVSGDRNPRRHRALSNCLEAMRKDGIATIGGCLLIESGREMLLVRDHLRCRHVSPPVALWDGCWQVEAPGYGQDMQLGPLGTGIAAANAYADHHGYSRRGLAATPALRDSGKLVATIMDNGNDGVSFVYLARTSIPSQPQGSH